MQHISHIDLDQMESSEVKVTPITQLLKDLKPDEKKTKILYPRQELIKKFVDEINNPRITAGYKPLSASFIASKMYQSNLKSDFLLNWFYGYCKDSKNFSKCWWWALKAK